jgi:hypothetical protein
MGAPYLKFHFYFGFSWIFPKPSSYWGTPMTLEIHFLITGFNQPWPTTGKSLPTGHFPRQHLVQILEMVDIANPSAQDPGVMTRW